MSIGYQKEISQKQDLYAAFDKVIAQLRATPPLTRKAGDEEEATKKFTEKHGFNPLDISLRKTHQDQYDAYEHEIRTTQQRISSASMKGMIGAPIIGEMATSALQSAGATNAASAMSSITDGATEASQALFALNNKAGIAIAAFLMLNKGQEAIAKWTAGVGTADKALDLAKTRLENLVVP